MQRLLLTQRQHKATMSLALWNKLPLAVGVSVLGLLAPVGMTYAAAGEAESNFEGYMYKMDAVVVKGRVIDATGAPIIGATIKEASTSNGTITDFDGNFSLNVAEGATIEISYIGYKTQTLKITGNKDLVITLAEDTEVLDEIVVVGYGVARKKDLTGSVGLVKGDDIASRKTTQLSNALQGAVSGVMVSRDNGSPGQTANIST